MSTFDTFSNVSQALVGTAPAIFVATTPDVLGTVTASGYLTDLCVTDGNAAPLKTGDIIFLNYDSDGTPGWTAGYVTNPSTGVYNFVQGIQGVVPGLLLAKKVVNGASFAGGAAAQTITDAAILTTDVVMVSTNTSANAVSLQKIVPGAGSIALTFSADPGAGTCDYVVYATV